MGSRDALRQRDFALFFSAAAVSNAGSWMQLVALPAILFDLTNSATWLGISSAASLVPAVILTPYAGVLADRVSRRRILLATQGVQMAVAFTLFGLYTSGSLTAHGIVICGFIAGCATGIQTATWQSFVPQLVPREYLLDAVKLNSAQYTLARALGPALAGVIVKASGPGLALFVDAITFVLVIGALFLSNPRRGSTVVLDGSIMEVMRDGAAYVWRHRPLRLAVQVAFLGAVCGQAMQYMAPAVSERLFRHPSTDNAGLLVALGTGALCSWAFFVWSGERVRRSSRVGVTLAIYTASILVIASSDHYALGLLGYGLNGVAHLQLAMSLSTLIQGSVPDHVRGRTTSFYMLGLLAGIPTGAFVIGRLADALGMQQALFLDAAVLGTVTLGLIVTGRLRQLDETSFAEAQEGDDIIAVPGLAT